MNPQEIQQPSGLEPNDQQSNGQSVSHPEMAEIISNLKAGGLQMGKAYRSLADKEELKAKEFDRQTKLAEEPYKQAQTAYKQAKTALKLAHKSFNDPQVKAREKRWAAERYLDGATEAEEAAQHCSDLLNKAESIDDRQVNQAGSDEDEEKRPKGRRYF